MPENIDSHRYRAGLLALTFKERSDSAGRIWPVTFARGPPAIRMRVNVGSRPQRRQHAEAWRVEVGTRLQQRFGPRDQAFQLSGGEQKAHCVRPGLGTE